MVITELQAIHMYIFLACSPHAFTMRDHGEVEIMKNYLFETKPMATPGPIKSAIKPSSNSLGKHLEYLRVFVLMITFLHLFEYLWCHEY